MVTSQACWFQNNKEINLLSAGITQSEIMTDALHDYL